MAEETETNDPGTEPTPGKESEPKEPTGFSEEDIKKLIEGARKQEKDKLYETINSLKTQVTSLTETQQKERTEKERIEQEAKEKTEEERVAKLSAEDKATERFKKLEDRLAKEELERQKLRQELEDKQTELELEQYKAHLLEEAGNEIIKEMVQGKTKEELQGSVATAKARYQEYFDETVTRAKGTPGRQVQETMTGRLPGPGDPDLDPLDEKDLEGLLPRISPDTSVKSKRSREEILASRNQPLPETYMKGRDERLALIEQLYKRANS